MDEQWYLLLVHWNLDDSWFESSGLLLDSKDDSSCLLSYDIWPSRFETLTPLSFYNNAPTLFWMYAPGSFKEHALSAEYDETHDFAIQNFQFDITSTFPCVAVLNGIIDFLKISSKNLWKVGSSDLDLVQYSDLYANTARIRDL